MRARRRCSDDVLSSSSISDLVGCVCVRLVGCPLVHVCADRSIVRSFRPSVFLPSILPMQNRSLSRCTHTKTTRGYGLGWTRTGGCFGLASSFGRSRCEPNLQTVATVTMCLLFLCLCAFCALGVRSAWLCDKEKQISVRQTRHARCLSGRRRFIMRQPKPSPTVEPTISNLPARIRTTVVAAKRNNFRHVDTLVCYVPTRMPCRPAITKMPRLASASLSLFSLRAWFVGQLGGCWDFVARKQQRSAIRSLSKKSTATSHAMCRRVTRRFCWAITYILPLLMKCS